MQFTFSRQENHDERKQKRENHGDGNRTVGKIF